MNSLNFKQILAIVRIPSRQSWTYQFYTTEATHPQGGDDLQILQLDVGELLVRFIPDRGQQNVRAITPTGSRNNTNKI